MNTEPLTKSVRFTSAHLRNPETGKPAKFVFQFKTAEFYRQERLQRELDAVRSLRKPSALEI